MWKWKGGEAEKEHIHRSIKHTSLPSRLKKQAMFPLISFFFFCSPKWRVWFETQPTNNASRESTLHKEAATEVVDLKTREKWKEFATSTLWTVHTTAKAVRRHCCFRGEQIGATTSTHAHVCCACAWCNQCTWSTYSAPSHKSSQSLATPFLSLSFHYGRQPMSGCSTNTRFLMHINH